MMRLRVKITMLIFVALGLPVVWFEYRTNKTFKLRVTRALDIVKEPSSNRMFWTVLEEPEAEVATPRVTPPTQLPMCPEVPENLAPSYHPMVRVEELHRNSSFLKAVQLGGTYKPRDCQAREHLAIIVPYRDRPEHLRDFLSFMHKFLQKQQLHYTIFVAEMINGTVFNTGLLQNVGFAVADRTDNFTCFIIHDVDLLPFNETNLYRCADVPKHLVHINTKFGTKWIIYQHYFGGAVALRKEHFVKANGFSNLYFGWGGQDDDFQERLRYAGYSWIRVPKPHAYYYAIPHQRDKGNPEGANKHNLLKHTKENMGKDGLKSLKFTQKAFEKRALYTWILVDIDIDEVIKNFTSSMPDLQKLKKQQDQMVMTQHIATMQDETK